MAKVFINSIVRKPIDATVPFVIAVGAPMYTTKKEDGTVIADPGSVVTSITYHPANKKYENGKYGDFTGYLVRLEDKTQRRLIKESEVVDVGITVLETENTQGAEGHEG